MDVARGELVEAELGAFIERRSRQKDPDEADAGHAPPRYPQGGPYLDG